MKNKIFLIVFIMVFMAWSGVSYAVGQGNVVSRGASDEVSVQVETGKQDDFDQKEETEQEEDGQENNLNKEQNKNKVQNQGEEKAIQAKEKEREIAGANARALERRSEVANAVQEMLQVADREGGIGEQVRVIAQNQNKNQEEIESTLEKVESRSGITKFLIGPNYGQIKNTEKLLEQNALHIAQLNEIKSQITNEADAEIIANQIEVLEQANIQIKNALENQEKGFSLLGWMFKLLSK